MSSGLKANGVPIVFGNAGRMPGFANQCSLPFGGSAGSGGLYWPGNSLRSATWFKCVAHFLAQAFSVM